MSHARIEEVSDSDPSEGDISDVDEEFDERDILKARSSQPQAAPSYLSSSLSHNTAAHPDAIPQSKLNPSLINPRAIPGVSPAASGFGRAGGSGGPQIQHVEDDSKYKDYQCIYPIYFDKGRSRGEGRMVGQELAVENPLAREIVNACGRLRLETVFEPGKCHPRDWANPGRIKVKLKGGQNPSIKNKHHLYTLISKHLQANPSTAATAYAVRVPGVPPPDTSKPYPTPAVPKGWKMGNLLPYYSPALTGGGVSDNFFKDMMAEMQGAGGMPGGGGMPDLEAMRAMMGGMGGMGGMPGMGGLGGMGALGDGGGGAVSKKEKKKKK